MRSSAWTRTGSGQLTVTMSGPTLCLDAYNHQTTSGTKVVTRLCNGGTNQKWNLS